MMVLVFIMAFRSGGPVLAPMGMGLAIYILFGAFAEIASRIWRKSEGIQALWNRLSGLPLSAFGTAVAHAGVGVVLLGLAATGWGIENIVAIKPNQPVALGPYEVVLEGLISRHGPNYEEAVAQMSVRKGGVVVAQIEPAKRNYAARRWAPPRPALSRSIWVRFMSAWPIPMPMAQLICGCIGNRWSR